MSRSESVTGAGVEAELDLRELIKRHEAIDWHEVPGVGTAEAAVRTQRLIEARSELEGRSDE